MPSRPVCKFNCVGLSLGDRSFLFTMSRLVFFSVDIDDNDDDVDDDNARRVGARKMLKRRRALRRRAVIRRDRRNESAIVLPRRALYSRETIIKDAVSRRATRHRTFNESARPRSSGVIRQVNYSYRLRYTSSQTLYLCAFESGRSGDIELVHLIFSRPV